MPERRKTDATAGWIGCATATSEDSSTKCIRMLHPNDLSLVHYFLSIRRVEVCSRDKIEISLLELVFDAVRVGDSDALG
jgi:hypothetical protein